VSGVTGLRRLPAGAGALAGVVTWTRIWPSSVLLPAAQFEKRHPMVYAEGDAAYRCIHPRCGEFPIEGEPTSLSATRVDAIGLTFRALPCLATHLTSRGTASASCWTRHQATNGGWAGRWRRAR
jgi:hypothetical protein